MRWNAAMKENTRSHANKKYYGGVIEEGIYGKYVLHSVVPGSGSSESQPIVSSESFQNT